jgi:hypothetical protein
MFACQGLTGLVHIFQSFSSFPFCASFLQSDLGRRDENRLIDSPVSWPGTHRLNRGCRGAFESEVAAMIATAKCLGYDPLLLGRRMEDG